MKKGYVIEQLAENRWFYKFSELNSIGEKITIEVIKWVYIGVAEDKKSIPYLWKKYGYIDRILESYWSIHTYVTDTEGNCYEKYNPQVIVKYTPETETTRPVINFDWMFDATEDNKQKLIDEVYRLFSSATGKTATEKKYEKIKEFVNAHNVELLTEILHGWKDIGGMTAPIGTTWISNMEPFRSGKRKKALLLLR